MRVLLLLFALYASVALAQLRLLNKTTYPNAVCIDGTQGGYYYRVNNAVKNWIIYHQGGGECFTLSDCALRANTSLGSSSRWGSTTGFGGMLSADKNVNPFLSSWNVIQIQYCDGQSFLGDALAAVNYNGQNLFFRGQAILEAVVSDLNANFGLKLAQNVIITGSSAGGIATFTHVDWWASNMPTGARVVGVPDAGWFDAASSKRQVEGFSDFMETCNCKAGVDQTCYSHYGNAGSCFGAHNLIPFISTPLFIIQSRFDAWQAVNTLGITCIPPNCTPAQMQQLNNHGAGLYNSMVDAGVFTSNKISIFMDSCYIHVQTPSAKYWNNVTINGETMSTAFNRWFANGAKVQDVNNCDFNCNLSC